MKSGILISFIFIALGAKGQPLYFPPIEGNDWDTVSPSSLGWCIDEIPSLLEFLEDKDSKAFIILKDGKIALEHYFGSFTRDSLWYWASAGKSLTAFLVGLAQEQGYLSIENRTSDYLGDGWTSCPPEKEELILVRHQLSMSTGLDDQVPNLDCTDDTCLQYLADAGTRWSYHNAPYTLLEGVIDSATGVTLNSFLTSELKEKTGMDGLYWPMGYNRVYLSTARSMARYGLLILNEGIWDQDTIMHDTGYFRDMVNTSQEHNLSYGYLWWLNGRETHMLPYTQFVFQGDLVPAAPPDLFSAQGKNDQKIYVVPSQGLVVVRMGNSSGMPALAALSFNSILWGEIMEVLCNTTETEEHQPYNHKTIYPNPVNSILNLKLPPGTKSFMVNIYNRNGAKISSFHNTSPIDVSKLAPGVYFLVVLNESGEVIMKSGFMKKQ